jgi:TFIIF-interacting CTD phosphatase-like protein
MDILLSLKDAYVYEIITLGLVLNSYTIEEIKIGTRHSLSNCLKYLYENFLYITYFAIQISSKESPGLDRCLDKISNKPIDFTYYLKMLSANNKLIYNELNKYLEQNNLNHDEDSPSSNNLQYFQSVLKNHNTVNYEDLRDHVYNELFLNNLLHYKVGEPEIVICDQGEDETVCPPFLPASNNQDYTLVLDLDETLVHYVEEDGMAFVQIRPGTENFLYELKDYYEIVIFTAALSDVYIHNIVC